MSPSSASITVSWYFPAFVALYLKPGAGCHHVVRQQTQQQSDFQPRLPGRMVAAAPVVPWRALATIGCACAIRAMHSAPNLAGAVAAVVHSRAEAAGAAPRHCQAAAASSAVAEAVHATDLHAALLACTRAAAYRVGQGRAMQALQDRLQPIALLDQFGVQAGPSADTRW